MLTAGLIISCPAITLLASNRALSQVSKSLAKSGAMVCGFEGAHYVHNSNALVMEAADLFGSRSCNLHGIKTFNGAKIDDAILQTAAVVMQIKARLPMFLMMLLWASSPFCRRLTALFMRIKWAHRLGYIKRKSLSAIAIC